MNDDLSLPAAPATAEDELREFKVHVPLHLHLMLHRRRLLRGHPISATVSEALDAYFAKHLPDDPMPS